MECFVSALAIYPLKSAAGIPVPSARITPRGLEWDRHWMLVDADGHFVTQRLQPRMALIRASVENEMLALEAPGMPDLLARPYTPVTLHVKVWNDQVPAETVSAEADAWLSAFLGAKVRLVHFPEAVQREVDPFWAGNGQFTSFSDGFPFLVTTQSGFDRLSQQWGRPVHWLRFRPNIVIGGTALPFAEDKWSELQISGTKFAMVKPCSRCVIPSIDPVTALKDSGFQQMLAQERREADGKIYLGQNAVVTTLGGEGRISTGDRVQWITAS